MTISEKQYQRLEQLETAFKELIVAELSMILKDGKTSWYLVRRSSTGKFWKNKEVVRLEKMEKDIIQLRTKLGEPVPGDLINILNEYDKHIEKTKDLWHGGHKRIVREMLSEIEKQSNKAL